MYFHQKKYPQEIGVDEIRAYLSHLAIHKTCGGFYPEYYSPSP
ncbi:hypothetical protein [Picosynechococcus sp. PCC 11901]